MIFIVLSLDTFFSKVLVTFKVTFIILIICYIHNNEFHFINNESNVLMLTLGQKGTDLQTVVAESGVDLNEVIMPGTKPATNAMKI